MTLVRITPPAAAPVSLIEVKEHLAITHDLDDAMLGRILESAIASLDGHGGRLGRAMISQAWRFEFAHFPYGAVELPMPPIISIDRVGYVDSAATDQAFDAGSYYALGIGSTAGAKVVPLAGASWPSVPSDAIGAFVEFTAGYGAAPEDVPADIRHAIMALVGTAYFARESVFTIQATPTPVAETDAAIDRHRIWSF